MKLFIWGCILVLGIAPILDEFAGIRNDRITFYSTLLFLVFLVVLVLAFVGSWRDDIGNWSWLRAKSRLQMYYATFKDTVERTKTSSQDENLFTLGQFLFLGGIAWKAFSKYSSLYPETHRSIIGRKVYGIEKF